MAGIDPRLPADLALENGLGLGAQIAEVARSDGLLLRPAPDRLTKVYVDVTTRYNLSCRTCVRNAWDESLGGMALSFFDIPLEQLQAFPKPLTVFFGAYGEPLAHSELPEMIRAEPCCHIPTHNPIGE